MQYTPNFNFLIPEGTDTVNLLTQCYPNFTSLDTILQAIKESGTTEAVTTKTGTVHAIVRNVIDCNVIRWVNTANYVSGDTFTVDGTPVTATAMDGTALPGGAFVINQSSMAILNGTVLTFVGVPGLSSVAAQDVTYDNTGSGLAATNVQDAIDEVVTDAGTLDAKYGTYVSGTITAGNTLITLSHASITTSSFIDIYFKDAIIAPTNVTVVSGAVTVEIDPLANNQDVAVRITNLQEDKLWHG